MDSPSPHQAFIPETSPEYYIYGMAALNIPAPENTFGDWHFMGIFGDPEVKIRLAGVGPEAEINTNPLFGSDGVHECSQTLREMGIQIPEGKLVYSANHYRALLDLVLHFKETPAPVPLHDFLGNEEEIDGLQHFIERHRQRIPVQSMHQIETWIKSELERGSYWDRAEDS